MTKSKGDNVEVDPFFAATSRAYLALKDLTPAETIEQALDVIAQRLGVRARREGSGGRTDGDEQTDQQNRDQTKKGGKPTPQAFMKEKKPDKQIEKVTCLAYYLTHHDDKSSFDTKAFTELNDAAKGPRFTSASVHVDNAVKAGYLAPAGRGLRRITTLGESVVEALPDREKVKLAIAEAKKKKRRARRKRVRK